MSKLYWEDFSVGQVAEYGPKLVTAEEIKAFAAEFDPQPMHLDENAARATLVGGLCASGWHTCAMMMRLIADGILLNSSSMGAPGVDEIRWMAPVRPGDRLTVRTEVLRTWEPKHRTDYGFAHTRIEVFNSSDICVMRMTTNLMFQRRATQRRPGLTPLRP